MPDGGRLMKSLLTLLVLGGLVGSVFVLGRMKTGTEDKPLLHVADEVALTVKVSKPEQRSIVHLVQAPGDVEAVLEVDISSEIVAKIEEMPVEEGDYVHKGDLLCRLDDKKLVADLESGRARIAALKAGILQAEADFEKAARDLQRQMRLSEADATSRIELADYATIHKKAKAMLEVRNQELVEAEAYVKRLQEDLKRTIIDSPIDGVISRLNAKQGEVVITGTMNNPGTVIMSISDLSRMQVRARVDEVDVPRVRADQKARVYLQSDTDTPVPARVVRVASKGSRLTGRDVVTFETLLEVLSNDPRIKPGMSANVEIEVAQSDDAITIPVEAVVHRLRKELSDYIVAQYDAMQAGLDISERARQAQYIMVVYVMQDDVARLRLIEPGIADSRRVELRTGVTMEDEVIVGPYRTLDQLEDGRKVALAEEEKKEGASMSGERTELAESDNDDDDNDDRKTDEDNDRVAKGG